MFDFEKLIVYQSAKTHHKEIRLFLKNNKADKYIHHQLIRASMSIMLNIAEGSGRYTKADKKNYYIIARGSVFECVALFDILKEENLLKENEYLHFYTQSEKISKILNDQLIRTSMSIMLNIDEGSGRFFFKYLYI